MPFCRFFIVALAVALAHSCCVFSAAAACFIELKASSADCSKAEGWSYSRGAVQGDVGGINCSSQVFRGESFAIFRSPADISSGGLMRISFDASWDNVIPDEPSYSCAGVCVLVEYVDSNGRKIHPKNINMGFGTRKKAAYEMEFPIAKGAKGFWAYFGVRWARGSAKFSNIRITLEEPNSATRKKGAVAGATSAEIVDSTNIGANIGAKSTAKESFLMETTPPPSWPSPKIPGGGKFAFFRVDSPRRTFDRHYPHPTQLQDEFSLSATPGETMDLFFGVYAEKKSAITITSGSFAAGGNEITKPLIYRAHNWMRADGKLGAYIKIPEVLFPVESAQELPKSTSAMLMAQFCVPADAKPGVYRGEVVATSESGEVRKAKVNFTVLPFKLRWPSNAKHEMIIHGGPYAAKGAPTRLVELFKWLKGRGFESALIPCQYGPGMLELEKDGKGSVRIKSFKKLDDALTAYRAAGFTGTLFIHFSDKLEVAVAKALGITMADAAGEQTHMIPEMSEPWFKAAAVDALKEIAQKCCGIPIAILGMDEPNFEARVPRTKWEKEIIEQAGLTSAIYCSSDAWSKVRTKIAISSTAPGTKGMQMLARETSKIGGKLYLYSLEGSYGYAFGSVHGAWGGLMPSRQTVGWSEFLTPESVGHTVWLFALGGQVSQEDEMAPNGWASLTRYDKNGRLLSTLQMEGDCLGAADYAYLNTLTELLEERKSHPRRVAIAAEFDALKRSIRANWHPYCLDSADAERVALNGDVVTHLNADADKARQKVANWIIELLK